MTKEEFTKIYVEELEKAIQAYPEEYGYLPYKSAKATVDKMVNAMLDGSYNKDGRALKAVCKRLGVEHTYKGLAAIINEMQTTPQNIAAKE